MYPKLILLIQQFQPLVHHRATVVSTYATPYESAYHIVLVKDTTNNLYEMFEFAMIDSSSNEAFVEFGNIGPSLGQVGITSVGTAQERNIYTKRQH